MIDDFHGDLASLGTVKRAALKARPGVYSASFRFALFGLGIVVT